MIEQSVRIHDRHQVELKLAYTLGDFEKVKAYDISLFFFIPVSLGVTPATYSKREFFNDLTANIRVKTPTFLLRDVATGSDCPLKKVELALTLLARQPDKHSMADCDRKLKMFCCILKSALRDHVGALRSRTSINDQRDIAEQFLSNVSDVTKKFRSLRTIINVPTVSKEFFSRFLFADEFISLMIESYAYELLEAMRTSENGVFDTYKSRLLEFVGTEITYRSENSYPSVPDEKGSNEVLVFRKSVLKKFFESVLFLGVRTEREGTLMEQSVYALAAGLSMIFATTIAFLFQRTYGNLTLPVFVALVVSYMFKDRIKELLRLFLNTKVRRLFFDRRQRIFADPLASERIGVCRESFDFVKDKRLPANIWRLRSRDHLTEIENGWVGETVVLYRKRIALLPGWFKRTASDYRIDGINDILRVNLSKFLLRMDEPRKPLWINTGSEYHAITGDRVYHINLVVQCRSGESRNEQRFRIVMNKEGIQRIELVNGEKTVFKQSAQQSDKGLFPEADSD